MKPAPPVTSTLARIRSTPSAIASRRRFATSHADVPEAGGLDVPRVVDVAKITQDRPSHGAPELGHVHAAEFVPLGDDDQGVRPARGVIGVFCELDAPQ